MAVKKTIAIVGANGKAGTDLAYKLARNNYSLLLISTNNNLTRLAEEIKKTTPDAEVEAIDCVKEACWEADIIIVSVPYHSQKEVAGKIKEVATQKIVVHFLNAENNPSIATADLERLQLLLPWSKIVTIVTNTATSSETAITGADEEAVQTVVGIAIKAGFNVATVAEL
jgi:predicted dinucleotide-binding enzyme